MKITCQACAAKYTIADEKVLGKVVKIRCKKCGATIVINGNDPSAGASVDSHALDYAAGGSADAWMVNVAEGDQRTMADNEIVDAYRAGIVNDETFCWKDGMPDWLPLRDVAQLYAACSGGSAMGAGPTDPPGDDVATKIQDPPAFLQHPSSRPGASPEAVAALGGGGNGSGASYPPSPAAAARRAPGRSPAADLFSGAAQAGGEDDVMTSAPAKMPIPHDDGARDKMTGARNENSVLFSLNALTSKGGVMAPQPAVPASEASGLIDIRQLSAQIGIGDDKKQSRIDDIMNLAGGGAFSPSLSAPVLSAPPIEEYTPQASIGPAQPAKGRGLIVLALGAAAFVVVAAVGGALMFMRRGSEETADGKDKPSASAAESPSASAAPAESVAKNDTPQPSASESAPAAPATTHAPSTAPKEARPKAGAATTPNESAPKESSGGLPAALAQSAGASDQPFNMGEAKARLAAIAAGVQTCKKGDATGTGRVVVVFNPNGGTQSATISGPPFEGTPTGACVAVRFRGARVPPFGGSAFSVAKSFTIN
jgi:predicted Zn finger-like uncharacterized protein